MTDEYRPIGGKELIASHPFAVAGEHLNDYGISIIRAVMQAYDSEACGGFYPGELEDIERLVCACIMTATQSHEDQPDPRVIKAMLVGCQSGYACWLSPLALAIETAEFPIRLDEPDVRAYLLAAMGMATAFLFDVAA
jgi:hypothetical protein